MLLDYSSGFHYLLALAPEAVLSLAGMAVLLAGVTGKRQDGPGHELGWIALAGLAVAAIANGWLYAGATEDGTAAMIAVDRLRLFANWVFLLGAAFAVVISLDYVARHKLQAGEYYSLILFAVVGMMFMGSARDLMIVFLGLELMSMAVYALTAFNRRDRRSAEAGLKYFLLGAFASGFLLFGIALIYGAAGSAHIHEIAAAVREGTASRGLLLPGVALLTAGFAFKVSAVPFHMWTPDAYEGAPTPVTAFMAASVKSAAFVAFLRIFLVGLGGASADWAPVLWWLAAATMVVGNVIAVVQSDVKRMLAYSSIAHGGYLLVALVAGNDIATGGLLFYLLVYTVMNVGAFAILIAAGDRSGSGSKIEEFGGFGWRNPALGVLMTIFLLSLAGFPGTGGFMAKLFLLQGAAAAQLWVLSVILVLTTVVSYWYYLRVAWQMWMKDAPTTGSPPQRLAVPMAVHVVLLVGAGVVLLTGVFPGGPLELAMEAVEGLAGAVAGR